MMDRQILKTYGSEMLDMIYQSCISDQRTFASRTGLFEAEGVFASLFAFLKRKTYPNPNYDDFDLLAACVFVVAADPDAYLRMMGGLGWKDEDLDVTSVRGAQRLADILSSIADDHDYLVYVDEDGHPVLASEYLDGQANKSCTYASPRAFLAAVRPFVENMIEHPRVAMGTTNRGH